jgi:hypothetical protein
MGPYPIHTVCGHWNNKRSMHGRKATREGKFSNLSRKSSRTRVSLLRLYRFMMKAFVRTQNRRRVLEKRFDYLALVPAAAAICYPFLLNAFHAIVGTQAVTPPPLAIASATIILVVAFVVPFLGIALACRPTSNPGSRRLAVCQRGVADALCLSRRCPGLDQKPYSRRGRLVLDLARNRDLVAVCARFGRCSCACS